MKRKALYATVFIFLGVSVIATTASCDPNNIKVAEASVIINAPIDKVWKFNSVNDHAKHWSVFFAKIVSCPEAECPVNKAFGPKEEGHIRRAYRNDNENGLFWDEETVEIKKTVKGGKPFYYKHIRSHNFHGYLSKSYQKSWEMKVEQKYTALSKNKTKLTFSTQPYRHNELTKNTNDNPHDNISKERYAFWKLIFDLFGFSRTKKIFKQNLENIKHNIENGLSSHPVHPYKKFCSEGSFCPDTLDDF